MLYLHPIYALCTPYYALCYVMLCSPYTLFVRSYVHPIYTPSTPPPGLSVCYVSAVVIVAYYFERRRSLATGISVCGTGAGTFIFPPLVELLLQVRRKILWRAGGVLGDFQQGGARGGWSRFLLFVVVVWCVLFGDLMTHANCWLGGYFFYLIWWSTRTVHYCALQRAQFAILCSAFEKWGTKPPLDATRHQGFPLVPLLLHPAPTSASFTRLHLLVLHTYIC